MRSLFFFLISLLLFSFQMKAQSLRLGVGPAIDLPLSNFANNNNVGLGAELTATYSVLDNIDLVGQIGFHHFFSKKIANSFLGTIKSDAINHVPILFGARYNTETLFVGFTLGYATFNEFHGFSLRPQVGYHLENIDIVLHYTSTSTQSAISFNYLGVGAEYNF